MGKVSSAIQGPILSNVPVPMGSVVQPVVVVVVVGKPRRPAQGMRKFVPWPWECTVAESSPEIGQD